MNILKLNPGVIQEIDPTGMADNTVTEGAASRAQVMHLCTPQRLQAILEVRGTGDLAMGPHFHSSGHLGGQAHSTMATSGEEITTMSSQEISLDKGKFINDVTQKTLPLFA